MAESLNTFFRMYHHFILKEVVCVTNQKKGYMYCRHSAENDKYAGHQIVYWSSFSVGSESALQCFIAWVTPMHFMMFWAYLGVLYLSLKIPLSVSESPCIRHKCQHFCILPESDLSHTCFEPGNVFQEMHRVTVKYSLDFILEFLVF